MRAQQLVQCMMRDYESGRKRITSLREGCLLALPSPQVMRVNGFHRIKYSALSSREDQAQGEDQGQRHQIQQRLKRNNRTLRLLSNLIDCSTRSKSLLKHKTELSRVRTRRLATSELKNQQSLQPGQVSLCEVLTLGCRPANRIYQSFSAVGNCLVLAFGVNGAALGDVSILRRDKNICKWQTVASIACRFGQSQFVYGNKVYYFGGTVRVDEKFQMSNSLVVFDGKDLKEVKYASVASVRPRKHAVLVVVGRRAVLHGGFDSDNSWVSGFMQLDLADMLWQALPVQNEPPPLQLSSTLVGSTVAHRKYQQAYYYSTFGLYKLESDKFQHRLKVVVVHSYQGKEPVSMVGVKNLVLVGERAGGVLLFDLAFGGVRRVQLVVGSLALLGGQVYSFGGVSMEKGYIGGLRKLKFEGKG